MMFRRDTTNPSKEVLDLLDRYAGIGLWDAIFHKGDPMLPESRWRWSGEFRRLLGFAPDDVAGFPDLVRSWSDRLHPEDAQATFQAFGACLADRSGRTGYDVTYRLKMKDDSYRWFRAVGGVARDAQGTAMRACGSLIDVDAERNELERAVVLDLHAGVGLWEAVLHDGDAMHPASSWRWSPELRRLVGFDRLDRVGFPDRVEAWADRLHPDDRAATFAAFGACLKDQSGATDYDVVYRLRMKDGAYRWFHAVGGVARDSHGTPLRACGSLIDIHAQKLAEVRQQEAEAERRRMVLDLADSLNALVATSANRATSNAQAVAAATEQLAASITDISQRAARAAQSSSQAAEESISTDKAVQALVMSADRIGEIVKMINAIAQQTNLLALNATIEAARAGESGKGFAVVASEVKSLANQTAKATEDIAAQIASVQQEAGRVVTAIRSIGAIIHGVHEISMDIAAAVAQQDDATKEIAASVVQVVSDIEDVSGNIGTVTTKLKA
jgi:PAS domain-containing protein